MSLDYMYSLAYYDYDKLYFDLKERSGISLTNARSSKLDSICQLRKNLHYYNADGTENLEGDSSKKSRWLFFHSDFHDKENKERLWLAHFNYQKPKKTWTFIGMCTTQDLVSLCTSVQDVSSEEDLENIVEELKTLNRTFGDDFSEAYQDMAKNRVKSASSKLNKGIVKELKNSAPTSKAVKAKSESGKNKDTETSSEECTSSINEPVAVHDEISETNKGITDDVVGNEVESVVSDVEITNTEINSVKVPVVLHSDTRTHEELVDSLAFVEVTAIPTKFIEELASYVEKSCIFINTKALSVYFKSLVNRLSCYLSKVSTNEATAEGYCLFGRTGTSTKSSFLLFNSGLPSIFGEDIYILADFSMTASISGKIFNFMILTSKSMLKDRSFTIQGELSLKRIPFYDSPKDLIFDSDIGDVDLEDKSRFIHCLEERNERVSEEMQSMPFAQCCRDMKLAVMDAIKLNSLDYSYIKPFYNYTSNDIGFMLPYWVNQDKSKKPTLAIVLIKLDGFWKVATILPMSSAYASVLLLSPYTRDWDEYI